MEIMSLKEIRRLSHTKAFKTSLAIAILCFSFLAIGVIIGVSMMADVCINTAMKFLDKSGIEINKQVFTNLFMKYL